VRVCVRECARACVRVCVCVRAHVCACAPVQTRPDQTRAGGAPHASQSEESLNGVWRNRFPPKEEDEGVLLGAMRRASRIVTVERRDELRPVSYGRDHPHERTLIGDQYGLGAPILRF